MTLDEIKNELYKREADEEFLKHEESEFDARSKLSNTGQENFNVKDAWVEKKGLEDYQKKAIVLGILFFIIVATVSGGLYLAYVYKQGSFSEERVSLEISGPDKIESGRDVEYQIIYKNNNRIPLEDASIHVYFPENFRPQEEPGLVMENSGNGRIALGEIKGYEEGKVSFKGKSFNPKGSILYLQAELSYKPSNFNSQFIQRDQLSIDIAYSPLALQIIAPQNLPSGDAINYAITYNNEGENIFKDVEIRAEFPEGFVFSDSTPEPSSGEDLWKIGSLSPGQSGEIIIRGKLNGSRDDIKVLRLEIGSVEEREFFSYAKENISTRIEASPIAISQTINGAGEASVNPGENLTFLITYRNESNMDLGNVIITETIDSPLLDYTKMNVGGGSFEPVTKTIIWKASDHKELGNLEPGKEGKISFSVKVRDAIPVGAGKNLTISAIARADSPDIPTPLESNKIIASNEVKIKIKTKVAFAAEAHYNDPVIKNSGPIPPVVGQETSYTVHWKLSNTYNDITDARIEAVIPTGAVMTGAKFPENADLTYNPRSNNLVWEISEIPAGSGFGDPLKEVAFQIRIKPGPNQIGKAAALVGPASFSGTDSFTDNEISLQAAGQTTELKNETFSVKGAGKVTQ